ncbi:MAG: benzoate-CoA ligase family protein [Gaiellaceae bacterium]
MTTEIRTRVDSPTTFLDGHVEAGRGQATAIATLGERVTYAELLDRVGRMANGLRALGVSRGDRILVALDDGVELVVAFYGALRMGAMPVPVNPYYNAGHYAHFLRDMDVRAVVVGPETAERVRPGTQDADVRVVTTGAPPEREMAFDALLEAHEPHAAPAPVRDEDAAFCMYTSGTTGNPKGVVHRARSLAAACDAYARHVLELRHDDVTYSTAKLSHAYGLGNGMLAPLWHGATTVLRAGRPVPEQVLETIRDENVTVLFSVPTHYRGMLELGSGANLAGSLRACVSAGERLSAATWHEWHERTGIEVLDGIGSTEMLQFYCSNAPGHVRPGSTGKAVPGYELKIVDSRGRRVPDGRSGELLVSGPTTLARYWNDMSRTKERLRGRWYRTGDTYRLDEDGFYWFVGRTDDMLKVSGLWVAPLEIESVLTRHPAVASAAVVATATLDTNEICAFVVPAEPHTDPERLADDLRRLCKESLQRHRYPRRIKFVDELPTGPTGKLQRSRLRELLQPG